MTVINDVGLKARIQHSCYRLIDTRTFTPTTLYIQLDSEAIKWIPFTEILGFTDVKLFGRLELDSFVPACKHLNHLVLANVTCIGA